MSIGDFIICLGVILFVQKRCSRKNRKAEPNDKV